MHRYFLFLLMTKILLFSILLLFIGISVYLYWWRPNQQYKEKIQVGAVYMEYACGDCSLEMKVLSVNNNQYHFLIGEEIFPVPARSKSAELCAFISTANYQSAFNEKDTGLQFNIAGRLHKNMEVFPFTGCGPARCFEVDSIQYGNSQWVKF
jgi:hypothetical protein